MDEIQSLLEDSEKKNQACDVLLMPPGDADLSDEDSDERFKMSSSKSVLSQKQVNR